MEEEDNGITSTAPIAPTPRFNIKERAYAKDDSCLLLYEATVRKQQYAPKGALSGGGYNEDEDDEEDEDKEYTWHYFIHYQGWNVKFDTWVEEGEMYRKSEQVIALTKKLNEIKRQDGTNMTRRIQLWQQIDRNGGMDGLNISSLQFDLDHLKEKENEEKKKANDVKKKEKAQKRSAVKSKTFFEREIKLRRVDLRSRTSRAKSSISLPLTLKKVLVDEWEVISQFHMLHSLPSSIPIQMVLNEYLAEKNIPTTAQEENDGHDTTSTQNNSSPESHPIDSTTTKESTPTSPPQPTTNTHQEEWKQMVLGLTLFFDQTLSKRLLYANEKVQFQELQTQMKKQTNNISSVDTSNSTPLRNCEIFPIEHLLRLIVCLPEVLSSCTVMPEVEKSKILFKVGDLVRFLQKNQSKYIVGKFESSLEKEED